MKANTTVWTQIETTSLQHYTNDLNTAVSNTAALKASILTAKTESEATGNYNKYLVSRKELYDILQVDPLTDEGRSKYPAYVTPIQPYVQQGGGRAVNEAYNNAQIQAQNERAYGGPLPPYFASEQDAINSGYVKLQGDDGFTWATYPQAIANINSQLYSPSTVKIGGQDIQTTIITPGLSQSRINSLTGQLQTLQNNYDDIYRQSTYSQSLDKYNTDPTNPDNLAALISSGYALTNVNTSDIPELTQQTIANIISKDGTTTKLSTDKLYKSMEDTYYDVMNKRYESSSLVSLPVGDKLPTSQQISGTDLYISPITRGKDAKALGMYEGILTGMVDNTLENRKYIESNLQDKYNMFDKDGKITGEVTKNEILESLNTVYSEETYKNTLSNVELPYNLGPVDVTKTPIINEFWKSSWISSQNLYQPGVNTEFITGLSSSTPALQSKLADVEARGGIETPILNILGGNWLNQGVNKLTEITSNVAGFVPSNVLGAGHPVTEASKGFGSLVPFSIPYVFPMLIGSVIINSAAASVIERDPTLLFKGPVGYAGSMAGGLFKQTQERPYYSLGQLGYMGKSQIKSGIKSVSPYDIKYTETPSLASIQTGASTTRNTLMGEAGEPIKSPLTIKSYKLVSKTPDVLNLFKEKPTISEKTLYTYSITEQPRPQLVTKVVNKAMDNVFTPLKDFINGKHEMDAYKYTNYEAEGGKMVTTPTTTVAEMLSKSGTEITPVHSTSSPEFARDMQRKGVFIVGKGEQFNEPSLFLSDIQHTWENMAMPKSKGLGSILIFDKKVVDTFTPEVIEKMQKSQTTAETLNIFNDFAAESKGKLYPGAKEVSGQGYKGLLEYEYNVPKDTAVYIGRSLPTRLFSLFGINDIGIEKIKDSKTGKETQIYRVGFKPKELLPTSGKIFDINEALRRVEKSVTSERKLYKGENPEEIAVMKEYMSTPGKTFKPGTTFPVSSQMRDISVLTQLQKQYERKPDEGAKPREIGQNERYINAMLEEYASAKGSKPIQIADPYEVVNDVTMIEKYIPGHGGEVLDAIKKVNQGSDMVIGGQFGGKVMSLMSAKPKDIDLTVTENKAIPTGLAVVDVYVKNMKDMKPVKVDPYGKVYRQYTNGKDILTMDTEGKVAINGAHTLDLHTFPVETSKGNYLPMKKNALFEENPTNMQTRTYPEIPGTKINGLMFASLEDQLLRKTSASLYTRQETIPLKEKKFLLSEAHTLKDKLNVILNSKDIPSNVKTDILRNLRLREKVISGSLTEPTRTGDLDLTQSKSLNKNKFLLSSLTPEWKEINKKINPYAMALTEVLSENKDTMMVKGSATRTGQYAKPTILNRLLGRSQFKQPGDVDIGAENPDLFVSELTKKVGKENIQTKPMIIGGYRVLLKQADGKFEEVIDVAPKEINVKDPFFVGLQMEYKSPIKPVTEANVKYQPLSGQMEAYTMASIGVESSPNMFTIGPKAGRAVKDSTAMKSDINQLFSKDKGLLQTLDNIIYKNTEFKQIAKSSLFEKTKEFYENSKFENEKELKKLTEDRQKLSKDILTPQSTMIKNEIAMNKVKAQIKIDEYNIKKSKPSTTFKLKPEETYVTGPEVHRGKDVADVIARTMEKNMLASNLYPDYSNAKMLADTAKSGEFTRIKDRNDVSIADQITNRLETVTLNKPKYVYEYSKSKGDYIKKENTNPQKLRDKSIVSMTKQLAENFRNANKPQEYVNLGLISGVGYGGIKIPVKSEKEKVYKIPVSKSKQDMNYNIQQNISKNILETGSLSTFNKPSQKQYDIPSIYNQPSKIQYDIPSSYNQPSKYQQPSQYDIPSRYEQPSKYKSPISYDIPSIYNQPSKYQQPSQYNIPSSYESPSKYDYQYNKPYDYNKPYEYNKPSQYNYINTGISTSFIPIPKIFLPTTKKEEIPYWKRRGKEKIIRVTREAPILSPTQVLTGISPTKKYREVQLNLPKVSKYITKKGKTSKFSKRLQPEFLLNKSMGKNNINIPNTWNYNNAIQDYGAKLPKSKNTYVIKIKKKR